MPRTLKSRKRGGGLFNFFSGKKVAPAPSVVSAPKKSFFNRFTRKTVQPVKTVNPAFALAQTPKTSKSFFSRFSRKKKPNNTVKTINPIKTVMNSKQYEDVASGIERSMAFTFQKLDGGQVNPQKIYISPNEKKVLQIRFLDAIRQSGHNSYDDIDFNELSETLFAESLYQFNNELREWENIHHPNPMIIPFPSSGSLDRLIGLILDTDRERQHFTNIDTQTCVANQNGDQVRSLAPKTLNTNNCMVITNTPDALEYAMGLGSTFYIVVSPKAWSKSTTGRYKSPYYKPSEYLFDGIQTKYALVNSSVQDAFLNEGLMLVEPRLGFLIQKEGPELWNRRYWLPKFSTKGELVRNYKGISNTRNNDGSRMYLNEDIVNLVRKPDSVKDVLRIVLLTLQKYSSLRRFAFTKSPEWCSRIYSDPYTNNATELLRPDVDIPESGYTFNREEFDKEFQDNQRWANPKGIALFKSFDDPRLQVFFKTTPTKLANPTGYGFMWFKLRYKKNAMEVPIEPLTNVEATVNKAAKAFTSNKARPYTPMNELREFVEN